MLSRIDEINGRGHARGWLARSLETKAKTSRMTMAELFNQSLNPSVSAFNVPAECVRVTSSRIYYQFLDGSQYSYINTREK